MMSRTAQSRARKAQTVQRPPAPRRGAGRPSVSPAGSVVPGTASSAAAISSGRKLRSRVALRTIAPPPALLRLRSKELRRTLTPSGHHSASKRPANGAFAVAGAPAICETGGQSALGGPKSPAPGRRVRYGMSSSRSHGDEPGRDGPWRGRQPSLPGHQPLPGHDTSSGHSSASGHSVSGHCWFPCRWPFTGRCPLLPDRWALSGHRALSSRCTFAGRAPVPHRCCASSRCRARCCCAARHCSGSGWRPDSRQGHDSGSGGRPGAAADGPDWSSFFLPRIPCLVPFARQCPLCTARSGIRPAGV
jgi:hypothetical protein